MSAQRTLPPPLAAGLAQEHLSGIDGLRAIAAMLVVVYHAGVPGVPASTGVLAFFVLSGFLITRLMIDEEVATKDVSLKRFYIRRSFRIFPAFYAYFFLVLAVTFARNQTIDPAHAASAFFYVSNYYQAINGDPDGRLSHTWSLSVEEQFYLLWPLAFLLLRTNERRFKALVILIPVLWLYRELLVFVFHVNQGYIYEAFDTRVDHILVGCLLAVALHGGYFHRLWRIVCASPWNILITLSLIVLTFQGGRYVPIRDYRDSVEFVIMPVLCAILIAQLIAFPSHVVTQPFNWGWMRYLGKISYSIYLYQQLVVYPAMQLVPGSRVLGVFTAIAVTIAFAMASWYLVEQPFLRLRRRFA